MIDLPDGLTPDDLPEPGSDERPEEWTDDPEVAEVRHDLVMKDSDYECNSRKRNGVDYCSNRAGFKTNHVGEGRCTFHGGSTVEHSGAPEGNVNNMKHGDNMDNNRYYEMQDSAAQEEMDDLVDSMLDEAPFGEDDRFLVKRVENIAIDMHKQDKVQEYIAKEGLTQDQIVGVDDAGQPVFQENENMLHKVYDRLSRQTRQDMKDLDLLPDPDSKEAEAKQTFADIMKQAQEQ